MKTSKISLVPAAAKDVRNWVAVEMTTAKLPVKLEAAVAAVKPLFQQWLAAERMFAVNTLALAAEIQSCYAAFQAKAGEGASRVAFARLFDSSIVPEAKTRDLSDNRTYNRLNYLIDKVGKPQQAQIGDGGDADSGASRETVTEKRQRMQRDWAQFKRKYGRKPAVPLVEVEALVKTLLTELWAEEVVVEEVLAA